MILVTGASGLLGANLLWTVREAGLPATGVYHQHPIILPGVRCVHANLALPGEAEQVCRSVRPRWIVHCAALTNVDWSEEHPDETWQFNVEASRALASAACAIGAVFVYISTDSVFDGVRGDYRETDLPDPLNVYARSKLAGEKVIAREAPENLVLRTNIFGWNVQPKLSLGEWLLDRLRRGADVPGFTDILFSPVLVNDLSDVVLFLLNQDARGLYHVGAGDACSKYEFALRLAKMFGFDSSYVIPTRAVDADLRAPRPRNTSLDSGRFSRDFGRRMPLIDDGLRRFKELGDSRFPDRLKQFAGG